MKESTKKKINQYIKLIIKGAIMYKLVFALLGKIALLVELVSHLKRQRCENCKEKTECLTIYQGVRTNKTVKILDMSLRLKKVQFIRPIQSLSLKCIG